MSGVEHVEVGLHERGMRLDRWLRAHYPTVGFGRAQKLIRSGQIRVDGARAKGETRLEAGQTVRVPPLGGAGAEPRPEPVRPLARAEIAAAQAMVIYEDDWLIGLNKPAGLATQGGSGVTRHVDRLLDAFAERGGERPRLVHRLDRDTSGLLLVARTRHAAAAIAESLRSKTACKIYWAIVKGVPQPRAGRISTYLAPDERSRGESERVARHGEPGAKHAVSNYAVIDRAGKKVSWLRLEPVTGRKHQLRVHMAHIGHPILGDRRYFEVENWQTPGGMPDGLQLHARRIVLPHPDGGLIDIRAEPPTHMTEALALLGFDASRADADAFGEAEEAPR